MGYLCATTKHQIMEVEFYVDAVKCFEVTINDNERCQDIQLANPFNPVLVNV